MDKFYTCDEAVDIVLEKVFQFVNITSNDLVIEPSAGDGSFMKKLRYNNVICIDIQPEMSGIVECDFFEYQVPSGFDKIHVIGNPPFGKNGSMALKFMKHSMKFAESVSFILPKSFKKESFMMKIPKNFELAYQIDLQKNSFLVKGERYDVPCVFQIWKKNNDGKFRSFDIISPNGFSFVKKEEFHHVAFRRVGGKSGKVMVDTKNCNVFYFIRFDPGVTFDIESLQNITFDERDDTAGPRSISKRELIRKYNEIISTWQYDSSCKKL
uniref:DNA adenine methyltransferase n=1 Tax=Paramecium bursaria Chlorella virus NY2A TaxID=46021 RepID=O37395_PBCVN|nr:DNA adenine methyltransferase [Paramecium bursaria Chlorella virus NY2A]